MKRLFLFLYVSSLLASCSSATREDFSAIAKEWEKNPTQSNLVDFSYAGVYQNEQKPELAPEGYQRFNVMDYGAIPNDGKDDIDDLTFF